MAAEPSHRAAVLLAVEVHQRQTLEQVAEQLVAQPAMEVHQRQTLERVVEQAVAQLAVIIIREILVVTLAVQLVEIPVEVIRGIIIQMVTQMIIILIFYRHHKLHINN